MRSLEVIFKENNFSKHFRQVEERKFEIRRVFDMFMKQILMHTHKTRRRKMKLTTNVDMP